MRVFGGGADSCARYGLCKYDGRDNKLDRGFKERVLIFLTFFVLQFVTYAIVCWNFRAIAQMKYAHAITTDMLISFNGWFILSKMVEANKHPLKNWAMTGYVCGGGLGSAVSMWVTKNVFGS